MTMTSVLTGLRHETIDDSLWERMVKSICEEENFDRELSERILNQTIWYLILCSMSKESYAPSRMVDIGWHKFRDYSRAYETWCLTNAGYYIHHEPTDEDGVDYSSITVQKTVDALKRLEFPIDESLWLSGADCNNDGGGSICADKCMNVS